MKNHPLIKPVQRAFTLIELMIVIAIIAILATIAIPSYQNYTQKAAMSELLQAASPYKTEVEICAYNLSALKDCTAGSNGIQANNTTNTKYVKSVNVSAGIITAAGNGSLDGYSYTLTPTISNNVITWTTNCTGSDLSLFPAGFCTNK